MVETIEEMEAKIELYKEAHKKGELSFDNLPLFALLSQLSDLTEDQLTKLQETFRMLLTDHMPGANSSIPDLDLRRVSTKDLEAIRDQLESHIEIYRTAHEKALSALRTLFPNVENGQK